MLIPWEFEEEVIMTMKRLALVAIASLLALSACTASVRTYSPGYYDAPGYYDRYGYWHYY